MTEEDADYAMRIMNMIKLYGKPIRVNKASANQKNLDIGANIFIGNLDPEVDEKLLYDTFSAFGVILQTPKIMRDPETGNSKGYAFINFASFEASDAAIEAMNGQYLCNRAITISYAFKKDSKGERHGSAAERLLAAQSPLSQAERPHQLFADAPPPPPPPPPPTLLAGNMAHSVPTMSPITIPAASLVMPPPPPPIQTALMGFGDNALKIDDNNSNQISEMSSFISASFHLPMKENSLRIGNNWKALLSVIFTDLLKLRSLLLVFFLDEYFSFRKKEKISFSSATNNFLSLSLANYRLYKSVHKETSAFNIHIHQPTTLFID
ncbi:unnamed protein product [Heterobilharzia americana]|nr:unnamed protein product [Heterobilharzia americana]